MKKAIDALTLFAICGWFGVMGYSVYVDHAHKAAVESRSDYRGTARQSGIGLNFLYGCGR